MKLFASTIAALLFTAILLVIYYLHIQYLTVDVVFYAAIGDGLLAALLTGLLLFSVKFFNVLSVFERFLLVVVFSLGGYSYAISVPTVIDRSLSFYILEKLQQRGGGIKQENFDLVFTQEYVKEHRLIDVRLTEQLESGTIILDNGCVMLTSKGNMLAKMSRIFRKNLLPRQRLLMGEYSDALTDPFRESIPAPDYQCGEQAIKK